MQFWSKMQIYLLNKMLLLYKPHPLPVSHTHTSCTHMLLPVALWCIQMGERHKEHRERLGKDLTCGAELHKNLFFNLFF